MSRWGMAYWTTQVISSESFALGHRSNKQQERRDSDGYGESAARNALHGFCGQSCFIYSTSNRSAARHHDCEHL